MSLDGEENTESKEGSEGPFDQIQHIRKRPSMYLGATNNEAMHHLAMELFDESAHRAMTGQCTKLSVILHRDGSLSTWDDGPGLPTEKTEAEFLSDLQHRLTSHEPLADDAAGRYRVMGGVHGLGMPVINPLCSLFQVEATHHARRHLIRFEGGVQSQPIQDLGPTDNQNTVYTVKPDAEIFPEPSFLADRIESRLRELAYTIPGFNVSLEVEATGSKSALCSEAGVQDYVNFLTKDKGVLLDQPLVVHKEIDPEAGGPDGKIIIDCAMQFLRDPDLRGGELFLHCNTVRVRSDSLHYRGLVDSWVKALKAIWMRQGHLVGNRLPGKNDYSVSHRFPREFDFLDTAVLVLSVRIPEPQFGGNQKTRLDNPELRHIVRQAMKKPFALLLKHNPMIANDILARKRSSKAMQPILRPETTPVN